MMEWAWTWQKVKWKEKHEAGGGFPAWLEMSVLLMSENNKRQKAKSSKGQTKGEAGASWGATAWFWTEELQGFLALQVFKPGCRPSAIMVCLPLPMAAIRSCLAAATRTWFEVSPLLLFYSPASMCHPWKGKRRSSPLLNDSTNTWCNFISIPPYQIRNRNSSAWPGLEGTLENGKAYSRE